MLEVIDLKKAFKDVVAVDGVSFSIKKACCFGLLGPNGAGKTTTIEMLEGISKPSSGKILYQGHPIGEAYKQQIGIQFQHTALQDFLSVKETLQLFQSLYKKTTPIDHLVEVCALGEFLGRDTRKLSGGQRQRLLLAIALINDPELVFLDEPTTGLDPQARRNFWRLIDNIKAEGKTIVLTTHYMEEAAILCDELLIMDQGKIVAQGSPQDLLKQHFDDFLLSLPAAAFPTDIDNLPMKVIRQNNSMTIQSGDIKDTLSHLMQLEVDLSELEIRSRNLEDLFLKLTGKNLRG